MTEQKAAEKRPRRVSLANESRNDPGMLWQSYKAARLRKETEVANERLSSYIRVWVGGAQDRSSHTPMISVESDPFGLLQPSIAFSVSSDGWSLVQRPSGILAAMEEYLSTLTRQLTSNKVVAQLSSQAKDSSSSCSEVLQQSLDLAKSLARVAGCVENYAEVRASSLVTLVMEFIQGLWKLVKARLPAKNISLVLESLSHSVAFLHSILDPKRYWRKGFTRHQFPLDSGRVSALALPTGLEKIFLDVFTHQWEGQEAELEEWHFLQLEVLHMLGAVLCGSEENASHMVTSEVCLLLLAMLDPREHCTPLQAMVSKVIIKVVHTLHNFIPAEQQMSTDSLLVLSGFLNVLSPRYHEGELIPPCIRLVTLMLDTVPALMRPPGNAVGLKQIFVDVGCFEKFSEVLKLIGDEAKENQSEACQMVCSVFRAFMAVMEGCQPLRETFETRVGYSKLCNLAATIVTPNTSILQEALNMVVEGTYKYMEDSHSIYNTSAVAMLVRWLLSIPPKLQHWLAARIYDLCSYGAHNWQRCCSAGLVKVVVEVLAASQEEERGLSEEVEEYMILLLEVLGSHSIRAAELKQVIGALRPLEDRHLPTYYYRLQKALSMMAHRVGLEGLQPLYYFDLRQSGSSITIPTLRFPTAASFAFHSWVSLDHAQMKSKETYSEVFSNPNIKKRRMLYSFYTPSGAGFEAFFTDAGILVVATATRREFVTVALREHPISSLEWHSVCIVHSLAKKPWGKSEVSIYIDGDLKRTTALKAHGLSDPFTTCYVGYAPSRDSPNLSELRASITRSASTDYGEGDMEVSTEATVQTIPFSSNMREWGRAVSLHGRISSVCLFFEAPSSSNVRVLYKRGPNDLSLFQPKCPETRDLGGKLLLYYHAKACKDGVCKDLSPLHVADDSRHGRFKGQHYITWDIKAVLSSLGGVELLFPILEQVDLPVKKRQCKEPGKRKVSGTEGGDRKGGGGGEETRGTSKPRSPSPVRELPAVWWFDEKEGIASFLRLLLSMLSNSPTNQQVFFLREGPATIGALLQKVSPSQLTVQALQAVQELVEELNYCPEWKNEVYRHLLFNFHIWSRPAYSVKIGHTQYISTIVKNNMTDCRRDFGVQFMLDVIRVFYSSMGSTVPQPTVEGAQLTEEQMSIRSAIISNIKLYVMIDIRLEELEAILSFLAGASDSNLQEELLRLLLNLLTNAPCRLILRDLLWAKGYSLLVLIQAESMAVRLLAIKLISKLSAQPPSEVGPIYTALHKGGLAAAIGQMMQHELSSSIILALLELCMAKRPDNYTDYISNLQVYLAVLQLLRRSPLDVRHTICQQVISILHLSPNHVVDIANSPGWESLFLWLLTPVELQDDAKGDEEEDSEKMDHSITYKRLQLLNTMKEGKMEGVSDPPDATASSLDQAQEKGEKDSESSKPHDGEEVTKKESAQGHRRKRVSKTLSVPPITVTVNSENLDVPISPQHGPESPYRRRKNAFLDASTMGERSQTMSELVSRESNTENLLRSRRSLTYSTSWTKALEEKGDEIWRTSAVVTETIGYILWHSVDYEQNKPPWKVWGRFFASLDDFASKHTLIVPAYTVKERIFSLLLNAVTLDTKAGISRTALLEVALQLCQMLETFILSSYPSPNLLAREDQDVTLLKLSHTFMPDLDARHCSTELLEQYLKMLEAVRIIEGPIHPGLEMEIAQSATRVLLACTAMEEKEYYVVSSVKLQFILRSPSLPRQEVFFILAHLNRILTEALENGEKERAQHLAAVIRGVFSNHLEALGVSHVLPNLPDPRGNPSFSADFNLYSRSKEWRSYAKNALTTELYQYASVLLPWLQKLANQGHECWLLYKQDDRLRKEIVFQDQRTYQEEILSIFFELRESEIDRQKSIDSQSHNDLSVILQHWRGTYRFFTGERGAWFSRKPPERHYWKLDRTENFSRMRIKLVRNYNHNPHTDASQLRDVGNVRPLQPQPDSSILGRVRVEGRTVSVGEEDDRLLEQLWSDANSPGTREIEEEPSSKKKEVIRAVVRGDLITLMERNPGRLEVTTKHIYFFSDQHDKKDSQQWYSTDFKVPLSQLREIHPRRYNMSRTALEIFLVDGTNYFLNFPDKKTVHKVHGTIASLNTPSLNRVGIRKPTRLLQDSGLTQKWVRHEISNFDYLMQLNTIAGRTYNDLNQYPIFPWVLRDYSSSELDLENPEIYRDFSRPMGIQNEALIANVVTRYEEFDDPTIGKFHFGSHYSNAAGVMHFLIRLEPFTSLHIDLQSGKFDYADRQFFSIPSAYETIYKTGTDVKELIPEFFYLPEFLKNLNDYDFGKLQTGEQLDGVILPKWASSPEDFIHKHKEALESKYVSEHLHEWIDLIFGYKQIGPDAVEACNIFNYYSYEQNVDLDSITDAKERRQVESIINNFGQTPTQLFTEPHPLRQSIELARKNQAKGYSSAFTGRRALTNLFEHLHDLKAHCVDVSTAGKAVVFVGTPSIQTRALIVSGNPEQMVTLTECGLLNVHGWLPFSNSKHRPFTFQFDPNASFDKSRQYVGGPFTQDLTIYPHLFVLSANNKLLATGGHWDNSFRVYSIERNKLASRITHHNDIVTCMTLDKAGTGDHLITGSRDTTCAIWKFGTNETFDHPLQTLYGHDSEVLCVDINTELDMAISGAKDGTCIIHTVRHGRYMYTLPRKSIRSKCEIHKVAISGLGRIVVYSEDPLGRSKTVLTPPCLHIYNINGQLLQEKELSESLNDLIVVDRYLITGNARGFLSFRDLYSLKQLSVLNLLEPIRCISVVLDHHTKVDHTKVCTHLLVGLENGKLIIVSVKDLPPPPK